MLKSFLKFILIFLFTAAALAAAPPPLQTTGLPPVLPPPSPPAPLIIRNADNLFYRGNSAILSGNARVVYLNDELSADRIIINPNLSFIYAEGNVIASGENRQIYCSKINYDYGAEKVYMENIRTTFGIYSIRAPRILRDKDFYEAVDVKVTTCESENPLYYLTAGKINAVSGDYIKMYNARFYLKYFKFPLLWLPYYRVYYDHPAPGGEKTAAQTFYSLINIRPGYNKKFGFNVKTRLNLRYKNNLKYSFLNDYYTRRGWGKGIDLDFKGRLGYSKLYFYHIKEKQIEKDESGKYYNPDTAKKAKYKFYSENFYDFSKYDMTFLAFLEYAKDPGFNSDYKDDFNIGQQKKLDNYAALTKYYDNVLLRLSGTSERRWASADTKYVTTEERIPSFKAVTSKIPLKYNFYFSNEIEVMHYKNNNREFITPRADGTFNLIRKQPATRFSGFEFWGGYHFNYYGRKSPADDTAAYIPAYGYGALFKQSFGPSNFLLKYDKLKRLRNKTLNLDHKEKEIISALADYNFKYGNFNLYQGIDLSLKNLYYREKLHPLRAQLSLNHKNLILTAESYYKWDIKRINRYILNLHCRPHQRFSFDIGSYYSYYNNENIAHIDLGTNWQATSKMLISTRKIYDFKEKRMKEYSLKIKRDFKCYITGELSLSKKTDGDIRVSVGLGLRPE